MKILEIDCSVRAAGSVSRQLMAQLIAVFRTRHPKLEHHTRDVGLSPPHPTVAFMAANYPPLRNQAEINRDGAIQVVGSGNDLVRRISSE